MLFTILRLKSVQAARDGHKKNWLRCHESWKDHQDEFRRILYLERDLEISHLKAE